MIKMIRHRSIAQVPLVINRDINVQCKFLLNITYYNFTQFINIQYSSDYVYVCSLLCADDFNSSSIRNFLSFPLISIARVSRVMRTTNGKVYGIVMSFLRSLVKKYK